MTSYIYNMVDTWNAGATTFTSIKMNVTDTASNAASLLMDLQVGGSSKFKVEKSGGITALGNIFALGGCLQHGSGVGAGNTYRIGFSSTANAYDTMDAFLTRRAEANLRLGAADTTGTTAPTAQFLSAQSWLSSTTNNQTGANFTIDGSQGTGTGAGGSIIFRVAPAGGTSNGVQNALSAALTINSDKTVTFASAIYATGILLGVGGNLRTSYISTPGNTVNMFVFEDTGNTGNLVYANSTTSPLFRFAGTTSAFPALKRSSTTLQARLADDSAACGFSAANVQAATAYTVATLPGTPGTGMIARVTDASAPVIGTTVTGGGAAYALVNYNGANWTVIGV